ncbi:MAG TPA: YeeE/YedE family protein [Nitrospinae bacterium]|nr:YeeE/YedE family protein [Nitrospinota bacterium]HBA26884.1 YeeE/YedE family protein [Nitrospinota bacterium]
MKILSGLIIGAVFGFMLHRGGLVRYSRIMGALLLRDFKAMNFMFTGLAVAAILYGMSDLLNLGTVPRINGYFGIGHIIGGILFGIGMGVAGLCPGTCAARFSSGKVMVGVGVIGIFMGVLLYEILFPIVSAIGGEPKFITLAMIFNISYGYLAIIFGLLFIGMSFFLSIIDPSKKFDNIEKEKNLLQKEWGWFSTGAVAGIMIFISTAIGEYLSFAGGFLALGAHLSSIFGYSFQSVPSLNESTLWRAMLSLGVFPGAFLSSYLAKTMEQEKVTPLFQEAFSSNIGLRGFTIFGSGALMTFGALIGGGCTTGAFMSGWPTLSIGSFVMGGTFFAVAMATAHIMFLGKYRLVGEIKERFRLTLAND